MVKRLILLGLCVVGLGLQSWAQVEIIGPANIEFLAFVSNFNTYGPMPWVYYPDPTARTDFESPILMSFDVPPSPKSPILFFGIWGQYVLYWTSNPIRICRTLVGIRLISPTLPNIEFAQAYGVPPFYDSTNYAGEHTYLTHFLERHKGYAKLPLMRGDLSVWWIRYRDTGKGVPEDLAKDYINQIIDSGFTVEVYAYGTVQGMSRVTPLGFAVEVTRLMPKSTQNNQR